MNDERLDEILANLREIDVPSDSISQITRGKPASYIFFIANRAGLISIARACLETAVQPIVEDDGRSEPVRLNQSHRQETNGPDDFQIGFLQRMEVWPEPPALIEERMSRIRANERWTLLGCGAIAFFVFFVFVVLPIGILTFFEWFSV